MPTNIVHIGNKMMEFKEKKARYKKIVSDCRQKKEQLSIRKTVLEMRMSALAAQMEALKREIEQMSAQNEETEA